MALTDISHPTDIAMLTDLYELTMAQGLWESGKANEQGCFTAFYRDHPFGSAYAVMCGTAELPELVENLRFTPEDIDYLASLQAPAGGAMFKPAFLDYLRDFRAHVNIDAVPEGELVFPREPMVRVTGPALECQLLETALLNIVGFQTLVATKTARVVLARRGPDARQDLAVDYARVFLAADGRPVAEFGLRRAQGPDGGLAVARASYVAGCSSTSNVLAGRRYGIPVFGTHAHSWVMSFDSELEAFRAFAKSSPKNCTLLIDTYDVREGCEHAITVAKEMEAVGERLSAIRIDSGDLAKLSKYAAVLMPRTCPMWGFRFPTIWMSTRFSRCSTRARPSTALAWVPSLRPVTTSRRWAACTSFPPAVRARQIHGRRLSSSPSSPTSARSRVCNACAVITTALAARSAT